MERLPREVNVRSGDLTGCINHHHLVFEFGKVRLQTPTADQFPETNMAARLRFHGSKIIKVQTRISWPLVFEA
jgi:hypothetical protein